METRNSVQQKTKRRAGLSPSEVPVKRARTSGSVHYVRPYLKSVQNDVGHPLATVMKCYTHNNILQLPLQPGILTRETLFQHFQAPSWSVTYPVPLIVHPSDIVPLGQRKTIEPMLTLLKAKKKHSTTLAYMKLMYAKKKTIFRKACRRLQGKLYPNMVFKVAEELERDPDRWFRETFGYDFYFTGGSLALVNRGELKWLVNTVGAKMNIVEMVPLKVDVNRKTSVESDQVIRLELDEEDGPVYEICWMEFEHENDNETSKEGRTTLNFAFRRKRKIEVLLDEGEICTSDIKSISSEVPFISFCFLQGTKDSIICTSDLEKKIKIWDYNRVKLIQDFQLPKQGTRDDCWSCIRSFGKNYLICVDRLSVRLFKTQAKLKPVQQTSLSTWLWTCENASCLEVCTENKLLFVGTSHKLLILKLMDEDGRTNDFHQIITFTHNLKYFPTMIRYGVDSNQKYFVWLSSHLPGDTTICTFSKIPPKRFATKELPRKPWTVQEAFHVARLKGKCLFPAVKLKLRLQLYHSGLALLVENNHFQLFLQNSLGDVFYQEITTEKISPNSQDIPAIYHSLMLKLNHKSQSTPKATDFKNLHGFKKILACPESPPISTESPNNPFRRTPRWKRSVELLHQYKDLLAPSLLEIWGFRPNVASRERRLSTDEPMDVTDRITNWLNATSDEVTIVHEPDIAVPLLDADKVVKIESDDEVLHSIVEIGDDIKPPSATPVIPDVVFVRADVTPALIEHGATPKSVAKPARKRYVQGF